ncbi:MAG TPA: amino acid adenylation domain-containing protein [Ignavibacteria bacterium]|nr:amino acid adenylation domain-containing protein [Ignavibacteria bacterium]
MHPLSYGQKALLFLYLSSPETSAYNVGFTVRIISGLDESLLKKAFQKLINRHPALRTNFFIKDGIPVQEVHGYKDVYFQVTDASGLSEDQLKNKVLETNRLPYDLENGDLLKVNLFKVSDENYILLLSMHHIVNDGFSMSVILNELKNLYEAEVNVEQSALPLIDHTYNDYIIDQNNFIKSEKGEQQYEYWKGELGGELPVLNLPIDKTRPSIQTFNGAVEYFELEQDLVEKLKKLSMSEGTTLFVTLLTAYEIFLHRYTGQDDIIVGTPTAGRSKTEFEKVVGYFINPVSIRADFSENPTVKDFISQIKKKVLGAISNQDFPFALLVERMHRKRDPVRSTIFQTFFGMQRIQRDDVLQEMIVPGNKGARTQWGKLFLESYEITQQEGQFELTLEVVEGKNLFSGAFKYNTDLFEAEAIKKMIVHFKNLLYDIVSDTDRKLSGLKLLSDEEKNVIIYDWNNTEFNFNKEDLVCLHKLIEIQANKTPGSIAVISEDRQLTYGELNRRSNQLAAYLSKLGVSTGDLCGLCVERSLEMVTGILGILKAGAAYIPIDPEYPQSRVEFMIKDSKAKVLITQKSLAIDLPKGISKIVYIDDDWKDISKEDDKNSESNATLNNTAYVIYTSGSTGQPKGVMISHASIVNHMLWMKDVFKFDSSDSVFQKTPFSFDASVWEFYMPLIIGGRLIMAKPQGHMDTPYLVETIIVNNITILQLVPSLLKMLLDEKGIENCKSLKTVYCGGEALTYELQEKLFSRLDVNFYNLYGPTEATIDVTYFKCEGEYKSRYFPIGKPVYNAAAYVLDKYMNPVPVGVAGELFLGGAGIAQGYLNNPELTNEKFIDDIFSKQTGKKLYRTGDLAKYSEDGNLEFLGRADHQVKLRGFRIELEEIEAKLLKHNAVKEAVVIVREDKPGVQRLTAYLIYSDKNEVDHNDLRNYLRESLPEYMVPADFVSLDELPMTPNGKVDRNSLPVPELIISEFENYVSASHPLEEKLVNIWKDVLGIEKIGIHDNFFELGGDSIISIQIISRANQAGLKISPKQIFQHQTIAGLASVIDYNVIENNNDENVTGIIPLTPVQCWFFEQNLPEPQHYNHSVLLKVPKGLNDNFLSKVFSGLVKHHDALRLKFEKDKNSSEWIQTNEVFKNVSLFSSADTGKSESNDKLMEEDIAEIQKSINLSEGNLIKAKLFRNASHTDDRLLIVIHHLAVDGISWRILLEDLYNGYLQLSSGKEIVFPKKTVSFKKWSESLVEYSASDKIADEIFYWTKVANEKVRDIPADFSSDVSLNTVESVASVSKELSADLTHVLLKDVPKIYNTKINDILLTALILSYHHWSKESRLLINLEGHGREELSGSEDVSGTVGWFTSIFPVILELYNKDDTGESIKTIKEILRKIPDNGIGFGILKYLSKDEQVKEKLRGIPDPGIIFNYLGQMNENIVTGSDWKLGRRSIVLNQNEKGLRKNLIELNSLITDDKLKIEINYSINIHNKETIESFADSYLNELTNIITHCTDTESGGFTPSDFSAAGLNQQELDNLLANLN